MNEYEKLYSKEFDLKYEEYRFINQIEKTDFLNNKLNITAIHEQLSKLDLKNTQMDFDATSLYPSVMCDKDIVYLKIESGYTFTLHMNDVFVHNFNI